MQAAQDDDDDNNSVKPLLAAARRLVGDQTTEQTGSSWRRSTRGGRREKPAGRSASRTNGAAGWRAEVPLRAAPAAPCAPAVIYSTSGGEASRPRAHGSRRPSARRDRGSALILARHCSLWAPAAHRLLAAPFARRQSRLENKFRGENTFEALSNNNLDWLAPTWLSSSSSRSYIESIRARARVFDSSAKVKQFERRRRHLSKSTAANTATGSARLDSAAPFI